MAVLGDETLSEPLGNDPTYKEDVKPANVDYIGDSSVQTEGDVRKFIFEQADYNLKRILDATANYEKETAEVLDDAQNHVDKLSDLPSSPSVEAIAGLNDPDVNLLYNRFNQATEYAYSALDKARKESGIEDQSFMSDVGDFFDRYGPRQFFFGGFEDVTNRPSRLGEEIMAKKLSLTPEEFRVYFDEKIDQLMSEGFFGSNNAFAIAELEAAVGSAGFNDMEGLNRFFGALDIATLGLTGIRGLAAAKRIASSYKNRKAAGPTVVDQVAATVSNEAAVQASATALRNNPSPTSTQGVANSSTTIGTNKVKPNVDIMRRAFLDRALVEEIAARGRSGAFGRLMSPGEIRLLAASRAKEMADTISNPIRNVGYEDIGDGLGSVYTYIDVGKPKSGAPYAATGPKLEPTKAAKELAERTTNGELIPVNPDNLKEGYIVRIRKPVDQTDAVGEFHVDLAKRNILDEIGSILGSATLRDIPELDTLIKRAEAAHVGVQDLLKPYKKAFTSASKEDRFLVNAIFRELRDGKDSKLRRMYTEEEVLEKYRALSGGKEMPDKALAAYYAVASINESAYVLAATNRLAEYVTKGYVDTIKVTEDFWIPARKVRRQDVPDNAKIKDADNQASITKRSLKDDDVVYRIESPLESGEAYVIKPLSSRVISPTDVMGYNPGTSRTNPFMNYFLTAVTKAGRAKSVLGSVTQDQAVKALKEIQVIERAIQSGAKKLDDIIKSNNSFDPNIESVADYMKFKAENNLTDVDLLEMRVKERDLPISIGETDNDDLFVGTSTGEYLTSSNRRQNKVVPEYGGGTAYNVDPSVAAVEQFASASYTLAYHAYTASAIKGWVKTALKAEKESVTGFQIVGAEGIHASDTNMFFRNATIKGNSKEAANLRELQNIIKRRLNMKDEAETAIQGFAKRAMEYTLNRKLGVKMDDPANLLLKTAYISTFGFFNVSQLVMQGFHSAVIMAVSPRYGYKGAGMAVSLRPLLQAETLAAYKLGVKRFAKHFDMKETDVEELAEYMRTSGRLIVEGDAAEMGTGVGRGVASFKGNNTSYSSRKAILQETSRHLSGALDTSLYFFKTGERVSRATAINTAFLEFKAKYPKMSALSEYGRNWITSREQALTLNMNTASRGAIQSGYMKVPTQWLTFSMRAFESVFVGKQLTLGERARLFTALGPFFGTAGLGISSAGDYISELIGAEPGGAINTTLQTGLIDGLSVAFLGEGNGIGIGRRMAPILAFGDIWEKFTDGKFFEVVGGPSGVIAQNMVGSLYGTIRSVVTGTDALLTDHVLTMIRQPTGVDNAFKAWGIISTGIYRSKNMVSVPGEYGIPEALMTGLGFPPLKVQSFYQNNTLSFDYDKNKKAISKYLSDRKDDAYVLIESDDRTEVKRGFEKLKDLGKYIEWSGLSETDKANARRNLLKGLSDKGMDLHKKLLNMDKAYSAQSVITNLHGKN